MYRGELFVWSDGGTMGGRKVVGQRLCPSRLSYTVSAHTSRGVVIGGVVISNIQ